MGTPYKLVEKLILSREKLEAVGLNMVKVFLS